jgi:hypothetical protein
MTSEYECGRAGHLRYCPDCDPEAFESNTPLFDAMHEAASITCLRVTQFGFGSEEARTAHDRWRAAWIAWRGSPEAGGA